MVNPNHITPYCEIPEDERRAHRRPGLQPRARTRSSASSPTSSRRARRPRRRPATRPRAWSPRRRSTGRSSIARRTGSRTGSTARSRRSAPSRPSTTVLLPAMKEVGDKFGAGELILPFVLQSAEVMKRAVAQLENYLERIEGHTQGQGRDRDRLRRRPRHRQVAGQHDPHQQRLHGRRPRQAGPGRHDHRTRPSRTRPTRSASPPCSSRPRSRCRPASRSCTRARARVPGADRRRRDQPRLRPPHPLPAAARSPTTIYEPGVFYCKDAFAGPRHDGRADRRRARARRWSSGSATRPGSCATKPVVVDDAPPTTDDQRPLERSHRRPDSRAAVLGRARDRGRPRRRLPYLDRHVLFKLHWGGRGKKGEEWRQIVEGHDGEEGFAPRLERMWREQDYLHPRARLGYFPAAADGNELVDLRSRGPRRARSSGWSSRGSPSTTASAWPTSSGR